MLKGPKLVRAGARIINLDLASDPIVKFFEVCR